MSLHRLARYCLFVVLALGALAVPGSEGWAGRVAEGDGLAFRHRLLSAAGRYEEAARFPGGTPAAWVRLGQVHLRRGQAREAAADFGRAEAAGSPSREVLLGLASALELQGDLPGSLAALRRELDLRPGDGETWTRLVERAAGAGLRPGEIREMLGGAVPPAAGSPHGWRAAYLLGACLLGAGSPGGEATLRRAADGPDPRVAALARELLEAVGVEGGPGARAAALGRALLAQGLVGPALASVEGVKGDGPWDAEGLALKGYALMRSGQPEGAEESLRRSVELAPEDPMGQFLLGTFLRARGDAEGAARLLGRAARQQPGNPALYVELANALVAVGDYGTAEEALRLAVQSEPEDGALRLAVARFHVDRQFRVEGALEDAEASVRLSGRSAEALGTLGWALHLLGRSGEGLDPLREAVAKAPDAPLLRYRLGSAYEVLGRPGEAREQYLMVLELDGPGDHWRRARAALDVLDGK